jgi:hypothetical protein
MRIERYYNSVREEVSPLSDDATTLLDGDDYIGFFKACGPTYVRSIRRAQEVVTYFIYSSSSSSRASSFGRQIRTSSWWNRGSSSSRGYSNASSFSSEQSSMQIIIKGWGVGLGQDGSETFVASGVDEFNQIMNFAFKTMTKGEDSAHIGMVYGMEVVPWVENTSFQVAGELGTQVILLPVLFSLIPRSHRIGNKDDNVYISSERDSFTCKNTIYKIDRWGYCCEEQSLYNRTSAEYTTLDPANTICRPVTVLDPVMIKDNMAANGEFISRLDRSLRYRMHQMAKLEQCISAIRAIPDRYDYHLLKSKDEVKLDGIEKINFSVYELRHTLDPFSDFAILKQSFREIEEWVDMFLQPCYAAMFGSNIGPTPDTDVSFFMAYPWHSHSACTKLSCLATNMRWDRAEGGCVPGIMNGVGSTDYDESNDNHDSQCARTTEVEGLPCKYSTSVLSETRDQHVNCWTNTITSGSISYLMDHFCMPQILPETLEPRFVNNLMEGSIRGCTNTGIGSINVAMNKPAYQISTYSSFSTAGSAVDGNTDGRYHKGSVSHTKDANSPWWYVDLQEDEVIQEVVVWSRTDSDSRSWQRLNGFQVILELNGNAVWTSDRVNNAIERNSVSVGIDQSTNEHFVANRVRVVLSGQTESLVLAEVEVWNKFNSS